MADINVSVIEESFAVQVDGASGSDGRELELRNNSTHVQWRYIGDVTWINLVPLADITGDQGIQGERGLTPRGVYNPLTEYVVDDLVTHNGNSYICTANCTGVAPINITNWLLYGITPTLVAGAGITIIELSPNVYTISATP